MPNSGFNLATTKLYHQLQRALEQQMFFWGRDALGLLQKYGFQKRPRRSSFGSSEYWLRTPEGEIMLQSQQAGLLLPAGGGILFLRKSRRILLFSGMCLPVADHDAEVLGHLPETADEIENFLRACRLFLEWLLAYEAWVDDTMGLRYRRKLRNQAPQKWLRPSEARQWLANFVPSLEKRLSLLAPGSEGFYSGRTAIASIST